MICDTSVCNFF